MPSDPNATYGGLDPAQIYGSGTGIYADLGATGIDPPPYTPPVPVHLDRGPFVQRNIGHGQLGARVRFFGPPDPHGS